MPVSDDHREEDGLLPRVVVDHLVSHFFEGAVGVGAFALVPNVIEVPDEVLPGCELTEDMLRLREVQASYGPGDLDAPVIPFRLVLVQFLGKHLGELLNFLHQAARWGLL